MSTTAIGLILAVVIAASILTLHMLDRRLVRTTSREQWQARQAARAAGLADRRPQDDLEGWR